MNKYTLSVLGGGFCWGFIGLFSRHLAEFGIDSTGVVIIRCAISAICFGLLIIFTDYRQFIIKFKDIWCFLGSGLLSLLFFTFCYFNAINMMSLSAAAILLYTAPTIVMILSAILFKERITKSKLLSVVMAFLGCCLVSGIAGGVSLSLQGLLFGLGSGLGYALYTIFSRYALLRGYSSNTINFYSCFLAALGTVIIWGEHGTLTAMSATASSLVWSVGIGVFCCFVPYLLYTYGLIGLENGKASVLASVEPVVASLLGIVIYHEKMSLLSFLGVVFVLGAVVNLNIVKVEK